jgi:hypothetical protein
VAAGGHAFEAVWSPRLKASRSPRIRQRWAPIDAAATLVAVAAGGTLVPSGSQSGVRWSHVGRSVEYAISYFHGFNHLPVVQTTFQPRPPAAVVTRVFPPIRSAGADVAVPTRWFIVKAEAAYFDARGAEQPAVASDDYLLYVVQIERQSGEWFFVGGYAGELVMKARAAETFGPDRGLSRAFIGRASYTIGPTRSVAFEGAVRQTGGGVYARAEYSQAYGQRWRLTGAGIALEGRDDDFLGRYRRNSHATVTLRFSF